MRKLVVDIQPSKPNRQNPREAWDRQSAKNHVNVVNVGGRGRRLNNWSISGCISTASTLRVFPTISAIFKRIETVSTPHVAYRHPLLDLQLLKHLLRILPPDFARPGLANSRQDVSSQERSSPHICLFPGGINLSWAFTEETRTKHPPKPSQEQTKHNAEASNANHGWDDS